jgi:hypothetical protein
MRRLVLCLSLVLAACGGTATQKNQDLGNRDPNPNVEGFVDAGTQELQATPLFSERKLNELYADTTDAPGMIGRFTYSTSTRVEPTTAGGADPTYVIVRSSGKREFVAKDEVFVVEAGEAIELLVSQANPAKAHSIDVLFGVSIVEP